jgi:tRNA A37 methylthiotransferase MiaB
MRRVALVTLGCARNALDVERFFTVARRAERVTRLAEELASQRAEDRIGERVRARVTAANGLDLVAEVRR